MATNSYPCLILFCIAAGITAGTASAGGAREAASPTACQSAAAQPAIANAKAAADRNPDELPPRFNLADAWSDAGCFNDAVQVLQGATAAHPGNKELETRLRVAKSLVGEEHFFDNIDRADAEAKLKRQTFRCTSLADLDACKEALDLKPDDPALLIAQGDALLHAQRPADALARYRLAAVLAPNQRDVNAKITIAEAQVPLTTPSPRPVAPSSAASRAQRAAPLRTASTESTATPQRNGAAAQTTVTAPVTPQANMSENSSVGVRIASVAANDTAPRRFTNAAPESQSH